MWHLHKDVKSWPMTEALAECAVQGSAVGHLFDHKPYRRKGEILRSFVGWAVGCSKDVADGQTDQNPRHACCLLSLSILSCWLYYYLNQEPYFFLFIVFCPYGLVSSQNLANVSVLIFMLCCILRECCHVLTSCSSGYAARMANSSSVVVCYLPEERIVNTNWSFEYTTFKN